MSIQNSNKTKLGTVKWYDPQKGYGFLSVGDEEEDILLHRNTLAEFGQSSVCSGCVVEFEVDDSSRGLRAHRILSVEPWDLNEDCQTIAYEDTHAVKVCWYDRRLGYGFVNSFETQENIFVHKHALHRSGLAHVQQGEALRVTIANEGRDKVVGSVVAW